MKKPAVLRNFRSVVRLLEAVTDEPEAEAREIYRHLGLGPLEPFPEDLEPWLHRLRARRQRGEPLAYILGEHGFLNLLLKVTPAVLIPRPETETLALLALERARRWSHPVIVDVGTGSGAIALYLAQNLPHARVLGTDLSADALAVARENARRSLHRASGIAWIQADLLGGLASRSFHLVVSNPPYIAEAEYASLAPQVHQEPRQALVAGPRGTEVQEHLLQEARRVLRPGGILLLELAPHQAPWLLQFARTLGYHSLQIHPDLSRRPRVLEAHWNGGYPL